MDTVLFQSATREGARRQRFDTSGRLTVTNRPRL